MSPATPDAADFTPRKGWGHRPRRGKRYVAFVIDGGTSQVSRYTVDAQGVEDARQKLVAMGLLVRRVQPRWLYHTLWVAAIGVGIGALIGILRIISVLM